MTTRAFVFVLCCSVLASCGGGGSPSAPTPPPPPPAPPGPPPTPPDRWAVTARVVQYQTGLPLSDARVLLPGDVALTTDAQGQFEIGADTRPTNVPLPVTVEAAGHLRRQTYLRWERGDRELTIDLIPNARPFSPTFFRQLLRNTYEEPKAPTAFDRWTHSPRFYLRTVDQNGRSVEAEVLSVIRRAIPAAVADFTGGLMSASIEEGSGARPPASGWIDVRVFRDPEEREVCGLATVAEDPGRITLYSDLCQCGSVKVPPAVVAHEVGHALGFWHVSDRNSVMYPVIRAGCRTASLSADERYHAPLAYRRSPGHVEPDSDSDATPLRRRTAVEVVN